MSQEDFKELEYRNSCVSEHYEDLNADKQHEYLKILLSEDILLVTFTKKNGDLRKMYCTLQDEFVPDHKKYFSENESSKRAAPSDAESPQVVAVYDMEKADWRSFRMNSITTFEIVFEKSLLEDDDIEDLPF